MRAATITLVVCAAAAAQPMEMVGWQLHERSLPKLEEAIRRAPEYGANFVVFSHELFRHVDEFLNSSERKAEIAQAAAACERNRLAYWLWVHELDDIPAEFREGRRGAGRVEFDRPDLHAYLVKRYEALLDQVPGTTGLILTFHESGARIFQNTTVASKLTVPERVILLTKLIDGVARKRGKKMIIRNFFYEPQEMKWFEEALQSLPKDIMVMRKDTCHEFNPFYPPDPKHGASGRRELIEMDLGVEKAMGWGGHYAQVEAIRKYAVRAREKGLVGVVGRARLLWDEPFTDSRDMNLYAFGRFAKDSSVSSEQVWNEWAARLYPELARPHIVSALKRTEHINHYGRWVLGFWFTKWIGEQWHNYEYYFGHPLLRANSKWTHNPQDEAVEKRIYSPDRELYIQAVAEKDEVLAQIRASVADLAAAERYLSGEDSKRLREGFVWLQDAASLQREWVRAYFAQRLYVTTKQEDWRAIAEDALGRLERMDRNSGAAYGLNRVTGHRYNIDIFAAHMRWRMANPGPAVEEDKRVMESVRRQLNVEIN